MSNSGFGSGNLGSGPGVTTGTGNTGGFGTTGTTGSTGSGTDFSTSGGGFGTQSGTDTAICPHCGQSMSGGGGLEQFLGRLGITNDMINNLKGQFQNVDIDEYMNTARDFLKNNGGKAGTYAKENPGKVAAGVAALALGAGLLYAAANRDKA
jgi:hypothetical protein